MTIKDKKLHSELTEFSTGIAGGILGYEAAKPWVSAIEKSMAKSSPTLCFTAKTSTHLGAVVSMAYIGSKIGKAAFAAGAGRD